MCDFDADLGEFSEVKPRGDADKRAKLFFYCFSPHLKANSFGSDLYLEYFSNREKKQTTHINTDDI